MAEWLSRIDVSTTLDDVLTRPSAFNPYPEHADDGIEVWALSNPTSNPLYTIRYPKIDAGCRVTLPISYGVEEHEEKELPQLFEGSDINGGFQAAAAADIENWISLEDFWGGLSTNLASDYLIDEGHRNGSAAKLGELIIGNPLGTDSDGDTTRPEPQTFVRKAIALAQQEIQEGRPEAGFAIVNEMFRGFTGRVGVHKISNISTMNWVTCGLPELLFPNFVKSWRDTLDPHMISTVAHPYEIGNSAASIVTSNLSGLALDAWIASEKAHGSDAVLEKVAKLQQRVAYGSVAAEAKLDVKLDEAKRRFPDAIVDERGYLVWDIPRPLARYVLGVITSFN